MRARAIRSLALAVTLLAGNPLIAQESSPPVRFYSAAEVTAAFQKGAVLFDGAGGNYMIHASRREKPGMAEVHAKDADLIYVIEGTATFVTGGQVVDAKTTAPDEVRGTTIRGGDTRHLGKGDVVIVPRATPHQFVETSNPFLYYVVKVR